MNAFKQRLHEIVERSDTPSGKIFQRVIMSFIILSLINFSVETIPGLDETTVRLLDLIETIAAIVFTIEYGLRIYVAERKLRFIFSFFGIVDLLAVLPFFVTAGVNLQSLRTFRLLRLFRAVKILRYGKAVSRFHRAFIIAREELVLFYSVAVLMFFFAAVGIYHFEHPAQPEVYKSIFHSLWWAVATLTTVGYGDIYPITVLGRIFTFFILMIGLGIVAIPSGLMASALTEARRLEIEEQEKEESDQSTGE